MLRLNIIYLLALASITAASPALFSPRTPPTTHSKSTPSCTAEDTSSTEAVQKILDSTGTNEWLDKKLETLGGENDWVNRLWLEIFPHEGRSPLTGCGAVGSSCDPLALCSDYPSEQAYWTFTAVGVLHSKITYIHDKLLWKGWLDSLDVEKIGKDFSVPAPDLTWLRWVAAAFTMATGGSTAWGTNQVVRGMSGVAAGGAFPFLPSTPASI